MPSTKKKKGSSKDLEKLLKKLKSQTNAGLPFVLQKVDEANKKRVEDKRHNFLKSLCDNLKKLWEMLQNEADKIDELWKKYGIDISGIIHIILMLRQLMKDDPQFAMDFGAIPLNQLLNVLGPSLDRSMVDRPTRPFVTTTKGQTLHPADDTELEKIVKEAYENKECIVRVYGSRHSMPLEISDARAGNKKQITILLDSPYYQDVVQWPTEENGRTLVVRAGKHLGHDTTLKANLDQYFTMKTFDEKATAYVGRQQLVQLTPLLWQRGYALPDLGGIDHQTVSGFLATGSTGGSSISKPGFSLWEKIMGVKFIDGKGEWHTVTRGKNEEGIPFEGVLISMGLMGIMTELTITCIPSFNIKGKQITTDVDKCPVLDFFGNKKDSKLPNLEEFFKQTDYSRLMWWPQKGVDKLVVWMAERVTPKETKGDLDPYVEVGSKIMSKSTRIGLQKVASEVLGIANDIPDILSTGKDVGFPEAGEYLFQKAQEAFAKIVNSVFVNDGVQEFEDYWFRGIPMDNEMNDDIMKVEFTELWIPIEKANEVVNTLKTMYTNRGWAATGNFALEIYAAPKNELWMSPSYQKDVIRMDFFWFGYNHGDPITTGFYPQFWNHLKQYDFRLHWGKWLPHPNSYFKDDSQGVTNWIQYFQRLYPKWNDFMALRERMDPSQIYVNQYWRWHLNIEPINQSYVESMIPKPGFDNTDLYERISAKYGAIPSVIEPSNLLDIIKITKEAVSNGCQSIRAAGTRYCYGDTTYVNPDHETKGLLIDVTKHMHEVLPVDPDGIFRENVDKTELCSAHGGTPLKTINDYLWPEPVRSITAEGHRTMMGHLSWDHVSLAGTTTCGAHGTGINNAPLADSVVSIHLVTLDEQKNVVQYIIEPNDGPTDPEKFAKKYPDGVDPKHLNVPIFLVQKDEDFYSAVVSMGCFGIVYSMTFKTQEAFYLRVERELLEWDDNGTKEKIRQLTKQNASGEIFGFLVYLNPYDGPNNWAKLASIATFTKCKELKPSNIAERSNLAFQMGPAGVDMMTQVFLSAGRLNAKYYLPQLIQSALFLLQWPPKSTDIIQDVVTGSQAGAMASLKLTVCEYSLPIDPKSDNDVIDAVNEGIAILGQQAKENQLVSLPMIIEVLGPSKCYMSPTYNSPSVCVELMTIVGGDFTENTMGAVCKGMVAKGAKLHWGEHTYGAFTSELIDKNYPKASIFKSALRKYNASGMFTTDFTKIFQENAGN